MPEPIIELEPKNPFRWTIFLALVLTWIVVLALTIWLKNGALRVFLPIVLLVLIGYLAACAIYNFRRRK
ncbi:MAG: hypothetical protein ACREIA_22360 [Opitutaceae bacterium]